MFDTLSAPPAPVRPGDAAAAVDASTIRSWQARLAAALEGSSCLDDAGRLEAIRAVEELVCTATAAQAALAAELDASVRGDEGVAGVRKDDRGKGVASMVAIARRESPHRGRQHLGLARIAPDELPHTWSAWRAGRITEWRATLVARETACLSLEHRLAVDEAVAADPAQLEQLSDGRLGGLLRSEAARLDPASVVARRRRAEGERRVTLRPAPDTMTYLSALLPVKDGVAVFAALSAAAAGARSSGDPRSRGQVMADALVARVTRLDSATDDLVPARPVEVGLMMTDHALFGGADDTAHVDGFGPVPAELAREILSDALGAEERVRIRRLFTCPETGELVELESSSRIFRGNLARYIRLRDQVCRTPWCDAPVRHVDHVEGAVHGGPTSATNGQGLCEACNYAKTAHRWRARPGPHGGITTTLPTGHSYTTRPPPLVRVLQRDVPPLTVEYVLAT
jgi:hypothetical protein